MKSAPAREVIDCLSAPPHEMGVRGSLVRFRIPDHFAPRWWRDEMAVHDVEMDPVRPALLYETQSGIDIGEVGG
jgi:hypothetical protein